MRTTSVGPLRGSSKMRRERKASKKKRDKGESSQRIVDCPACLPAWLPASACLHPHAPWECLARAGSLRTFATSAVVSPSNFSSLTLTILEVLTLSSSATSQKGAEGKHMTEGEGSLSFFFLATSSLAPLTVLRYSPWAGSSSTSTGGVSARARTSSTQTCVVQRTGTLRRTKLSGTSTHAPAPEAPEEAEAAAAAAACACACACCCCCWACACPSRPCLLGVAVKVAVAVAEGGWAPAPSACAAAVTEAAEETSPCERGCRMWRCTHAGGGIADAELMPGRPGTKEDGKGRGEKNEKAWRQEERTRKD